MRILHVIESIDPRSGGPSSAFLELASALHADDRCAYHAVAHAPSGASALTGAGPDLASRIVLADPPGRILAGALARAGVHEIDRIAPDVVHLHGLWCPDLVRIAAHANRRSIPTVWQPHGMLMARAYAAKRLKKELFMFMGLRRALISASAIVCCTAGERRASVGLTRFARGRFEVVPLPVSCPIAWEAVPALRDEARTRFGVPIEARTIVFMGRLHPVKRLELTLSALAEARRTDPALHLLVFGEGDADYAASLRAHAQSLGVEGHVTWAGWVDRADRFLALAAGETLVLNSMFENFGYVIPEAMLVGSGVVATENLSMAEDLRIAGVGVVVEPAALARGMIERVAWDDRTRARLWVERTCSPRAVAGAMIDLYDSILTRGDAAR